MNTSKCSSIALLSVLTALLLASCSDMDDLGTETIPSATPEPNVGITFSSTVASNPNPTRADGSIINLNETSLRPSKEHKYYRADENGDVDYNKGVPATYYVGIFGCYTGQNKWSKLVKKANNKPNDGTQLNGSEDGNTNQDSQDQETLNKYYTANLFFNQKAEIGERNALGGTPLTYSPLRFWPNNKLTDNSKLTDDNSQHETDDNLQQVKQNEAEHEYVTFWAYYPYSSEPDATDATESHITLNTSEGNGMGRVSFTMQKDASQQVDFMMSAPVVDCNKDQYPLFSIGVNQYTSKPVPFKLYHMLAQVRIYAYINGTDKLVYKRNANDTDDQYADADWFDNTWENEKTIMDAFGNVYTKKANDRVEQTTKEKAFGKTEFPDLTKEEFVALGLKVPNEEKSLRWTREDVWDVARTRRRASLKYQLEFHNIKSSTIFYPQYDDDGTFLTMAHEEAPTLSSATINHYIMNPYWFQFNNKGKRTKLNDTYMFGYYEQAQGSNSPTPACQGIDATSTDGWDWSKFGKVDGDISDPLGYLYKKNDNTFVLLDYAKELADVDNDQLHYNFNPGNILLVVPQTLDYSDKQPYITIKAIDTEKKLTDTDTGTEKPLSATLTVYMLNKGSITWESGYIYCYAFIDDLKPGDKKVQGQENVTTSVSNGEDTGKW